MLKPKSKYSNNNDIKIIENISQLISELGLDSSNSTFVLFIGSAVSGCNFPYTPMVTEVLSGIFENIYTKLKTGSISERIVANYAKSLCDLERKKSTDIEGIKISDTKDYGKYFYLTETIKFEEFLGTIKLIVGKEKLNALLKILYYCEWNEYGFNQMAIRWLLESGKCLICLTTNFDNSIENGSNSITTLTHLDYVNSDIMVSNYPILLKLHGDVTNDTCVATNRSLFKHTNANTFEFLEDLLLDKKVLVLGYSGYGDVDINPILSQTKAEFYWCEYSRERTVPIYSKAKVICDLGSNESSNNLLQGLASHYDCNFSDQPGEKHSWEKSLKDWCSSVDNELLAGLVTRTFLGRPGWQAVHLMNLIPIYHGEINKGLACLQKSAYGPAEKIFTKLVRNKTLEIDHLVSARVYLGFVLWRRGKFEQALNTLEWFLYINPDNYKDEVKIEISDGLRVYLEVIRDWMRHTPFKQKRNKIFHKYNVTQIINKYKKMGTYDFKDDALKKVVLFYIQHLMGRKFDENGIEGILDLFKQSYYTNNWIIAHAVGRLLIDISFMKGFRELMTLALVLIKRKQFNYLRQSLASVFNRMTFRAIPWIAIGFIDGPYIKKLVSPIKNIRYKFMVHKFKKLQKKGNLSIY